MKSDPTPLQVEPIAPPPPMVASYASPRMAPLQSDLSIGSYLFYFVSLAIVSGIFVGSSLLTYRFKNVYEDFKLKLPAINQLYISVADLFFNTYGHFWIWLIPVLFPFGIAKLDPLIRRRLLIISLLLLSAFTILTVAATLFPFLTLIEGMSSPRGR